MRNVKRIKPFMTELGNIWEKNCPDWRFGQLLVNVINSQKRDPFFFEEDEMLDLFKEFFNEDNICAKTDGIKLSLMAKDYLDSYKLTEEELFESLKKSLKELKDDEEGITK